MCYSGNGKMHGRIAWRGLDSGNGDLGADVRKSDVTGGESPGKPAAPTSSSGEREYIY